MFEKDRSVSKVSNRTLPEQIKSKLDHYSEELAKLLEENLSINTENQILATKYTELTLFNQELGNDLACFDQDIENLEIKVTNKNMKFKKLCQDLESLRIEFEKYRKSLIDGGTMKINPDLLKSLEKKKKALIHNFQELNSEKVDIDSYDVLKVRAEITSQIREINEQNQELLFQIDILKTLLNDKYSIDEKRDLLNNALKQKKIDRETIETQISELKNKGKKYSNDSKRDEKSNDKLFSEFADDEDNDSILFSSSQKATTNSLKQSNLIKTPKNRSSEHLLSTNSEKSHRSNKLKIVKPVQNENDIFIDHNKNASKDSSNVKPLPSFSQKKFHSDIIKNQHQSKKTTKNNLDSHNAKSNDQDDSSSSTFFSYEKRNLHSANSAHPPPLNKRPKALINIEQKQEPSHISTHNESRKSPKKDIKLTKRKKKVKKSNDEYEYEYYENESECDVKMSKVQIQVNESDFIEGEKDSEDDRMNQLEQQNRELLKELKIQLKEKQEEKERIESEIENSKMTLKVQPNVNYFTIFSDPLKHITQSRWLLSVSNQTDLTGATIDFHVKVLHDQEMERQTSETSLTEIEELKVKIKEQTEKIESARMESERRDIAIQQVQQELQEVQARIEGDKMYQNAKKRMKVEYSSDIKKLKSEIRNKQALLQSTTEENAKLNEKLDELIHNKIELEHEIEELAFKEKPQIEDLLEKVQNFQHRVEESKLRLLKAQEELEVKRKELESVKNSNEYANFKKLTLRKKTLERRIIKWKMLLKDSSETLQSMEQFSSDNADRRRILKESVQKYEKIKFEKDEELLDTEQYSMLLESMLAEQQNNWV
ncbi:hypothetical protein M9Y10_002430 [Tritrichomonas musculus]|uniref:DUF4201 domain-containing protein n=1 Tax=Tritrichomonas musculus TaxID=1915356 RepID=A0ABR2LBF4_9EUKA